MGWFSGWFGDNTAPNKDKSNDDPLRSLDPTLRDFLDKESPSEYETSAPPPPSPPPAASSQPAQSTAPDTLTDAQEQSAPRPSVPPESLFPDGRYAHLWSTYKPRGEVENALKSDQEKLTDLLDGYKSRKARMEKAAMENCALEQQAMSDCYRKGSWKDKMTMCRAENRAFERCYTMQARFLKALGYLSAYDRPADVEEKIQMHADTLYHRMLDQEAAIAEAKAQNLPPPSFEPLLSPSDATPAEPTQHTTSTGQPISASAAATISSARPLSYEESKDMYLRKLKPNVREGLEQEWEKNKLSAEERMLAARAYAMEAEAGIGVANQLGELMQETQRKREERRKEGKGTLGDTINGWLGR